MACRHHITIGAMTVWKLFVEICFPIAFVLLVLLNVPAPRYCRLWMMVASKLLPHQHTPHTESFGQPLSKWWTVC